MWAGLVQAAGAAAGYLKVHGTAISAAAALGMGGARYADQQVLDEADYAIRVLTQHIATSEDSHFQQRGQFLNLALLAQQEHAETRQELVVTRQQRDDARRQRNVTQQELVVTQHERDDARHDTQSYAARNEQLWKQTTGHGIKRDLLNEWKRCTINLDQLRILALGYAMKRRADVTSDAGVLERYHNAEEAFLNIIAQFSQADAPESLVQALIRFQQLQQSDEDGAFVREFTRIGTDIPRSLQESRTRYAQYQALTAQLQAVEA